MYNFCAKDFSMSKNLTSRQEDYSKWYNELVVKAGLAENSGVRGCMVIKPYGYAIWEKMQELMARRIDKQPLNFPSAGSTFKRPEGYFAGKLIDDAGLRGYSIGGAKVSDKHCGFIVNADKASAEDVYALITYVRLKVKDRFGVELEPELRVLGEF